MSRMHADMPEEAAAWRAKRKECIRNAEAQPNRLPPLFGAPILVKLESNRPSFESVSRAFDKVHVLCTISSDRHDFNEKTTPMEQSFRDAQALVLKKADKKKRASKIHKRSPEEENREVNEAKSPDYVRDFDKEGNDVEDNMLHEVLGSKKHEKICPLWVKEKSADWTWVPAECVNVLKEREENISNDSSLSLPSATSTTPDTAVVWNVRQGSRSTMLSDEVVLDIARFTDLEEANQCAEQRFGNLRTTTTDTKYIRKGYRSGDRFIGYVPINYQPLDDMFVWVEKESRTLSAYGLQWDIDEDSLSSTRKTLFTPDTSDEGRASSICMTRFTPDSSDGSLKARTDETDPGLGNGSKVPERVQDGRDFFQMLKSRPLLKRCLPQFDPDVPTGFSRERPSSCYIAALEREAGRAWRSWSKDWERRIAGKKRQVIIKNGRAEFEYV